MSTCQGCEHWTGSHYRDIEGIARCMATERGTSSHGIIGMPWENHCDCENGVSAQKDRERTREKAFDDERAKVFDEIAKVAVEQLKEMAAPPSDSDVPKLCTTSGKPIDEHTREINPATGMQKDYIILCADERAKGFVRPYRDAYKHLPCGTTTTMGKALSETYARQPDFYSGTFCCACQTHFPLNEFVWMDGQQVGS